MSIVQEIISDFSAALHNDPALKRNRWARTEVILYQGIYALVFHRIAHRLYLWNIPFFPRLISQISRFLTGIEIHPGAKIGHGVFIDHGAGVVIGETAEIGNNVLIYHDVTLGGTSLETGKRHPTIGNGVMIGSGAGLFGAIIVGDNSQIGSGAVVTRNVPSNCVVVGNPARIVKRDGIKVIETVDTVGLPDPIKKELVEIHKRLHKLERTLKHGRTIDAEVKAE